jgi:hypothetical protein
MHTFKLVAILADEHSLIELSYGFLKISLLSLTICSLEFIIIILANTLFSLIFLKREILHHTLHP